jgi:ribulose-phosphate 3-epimerase
MAIVIPAILENDFSEIEKKIKRVEGLVEWVQIDFADNSLMPNKNFLDPSPFSTLQTKINLEAHLMVKDPLMYLERFVKAGFKRFYAHIEGDFVEDYISKCYSLGVGVGLAIDGPTPLEKIKPYLEDIDMVLVLAIEAGFSGRPYREDTADKIQAIKELEFDLPIAVDGAMDDVNAAKVVEAGATIICSNSYIFKQSDVTIPIHTLQNLGEIRKPL